MAACRHTACCGRALSCRHTIWQPGWPLCRWRRWVAGWSGCLARLRLLNLLVQLAQPLDLPPHLFSAPLLHPTLLQEARGLDAGDRLAKRLVGMGDNRTAAIVWRIALEERAHVAVGITWFTAICAALGAEPGEAYRQLLLELCPGLLNGPFNEPERQEVGLPREWYIGEDLQRAAAAALKQQHVPPAVGSSLAPVADGEQLRQLAARLQLVLGLEVSSPAAAS